MSGVSVFYPMHSLVIVEGMSGVYQPPPPPSPEQITGSLKYPDGRKVPAQQVFPPIISSEERAMRELAKTRQQLALAYQQNQKLQEENRVLKLAWEAAHLKIQASVAKEEETRGKLQVKELQLDSAYKQLKNWQSLHSKLQKKQKAKNEQLKDSEYRVDLYTRILETDHKNFY